LDDAGSGVQPGAGAVDQGGAQADEEFAVAAGVDPAEATGIKAAGKGFQQADEGDGRLARRAADGGGRMEASHDVQDSHRGGKGGLERRMQVLDVGEASQAWPVGKFGCETETAKAPDNAVQHEAVFPDLATA